MDRRERQLRTALLKFAGHRDRIELALASRMLWQCAHSLAQARDLQPRERAFCDKVLPLLVQTMHEPLDGLAPGRKAEVAVLINGVSDWALGVFEGRPVPLVFMVIIRWLENLIETEILVLYEDSACADALAAILEALEQCPEMSALDKSATKNGRKLVERLKSLGLYKDPDVVLIEVETD
jgi:hypothetical protein